MFGQGLSSLCSKDDSQVLLKENISLPLLLFAGKRNLSRVVFRSSETVLTSNGIYLSEIKPSSACLL